MTRWVAVGLALLACVALTASVAGGAPSTTAGAMAQPDGFDRSVFEITVYGNGSARWALEHHRVLENDSEIEDFEQYAANFRNNETALYRDFDRGARLLAENGANVTGRPMNATDFRRDAEVAVDTTLNDRGVIRMSFRWTAFAVTTADEIVVSDVFGDGPYLAPDQRMTFVAGPEMAFTAAAPESYDRSDDTLAASDRVWWSGEVEFGFNQPRVELADADAVGNGQATPTQNGSTSGTTGDVVLVVAVFVVAVGLAGAAVWHSRGPSAFRELFGGVTGGAVEEGTDAGGDDDAGASAAAAVPDDQLVSDSDRVLNLLEDSGGRMKQVNIVEETDWSKSKVSMLLSEMEEDGDISKLRVGRENIISLAGQEPDAAGSPFEDED